MRHAWVHRLEFVQQRIAEAWSLPIAASAKPYRSARDAA